MLTCAFLICVGAFIACSGSGNSKPGGGGESKRPSGVLLADEKNAAEKAEHRARARAQAEADAEAKNEVNRNAYQAEVERLKAVFEKKKEKYLAEYDDYEKAVAVFGATKKEVEAAKWSIT